MPTVFPPIGSMTDPLNQPSHPDHHQALQDALQDTGRRDVSSMLPAGWTLGSSGWLQLRRIGDICFLEVGGIQKTSTALWENVIAAIPGFAGYGYYFVPAMDAYSGVVSPAFLAHGDNLLGVINYTTANQPLYATLTWHTTNAWPSSLPGVPGAGAMESAGVRK